MVHDHTWSIQQCDMHEYDNAHDDYENAKNKRHKCNMTTIGMAMQYNQMMNMMQEAKYDNGTHPIMATNTPKIKVLQTS